MADLFSTFVESPRRVVVRTPPPNVQELLEVVRNPNTPEVARYAARLELGFLGTKGNKSKNRKPRVCKTTPETRKITARNARLAKKAREDALKEQAYMRELHPKFDPSVEVLED